MRVRVRVNVFVHVHVHVHDPPLHPPRTRYSRRVYVPLSRFLLRAPLLPICGLPAGPAVACWRTRLGARPSRMRVRRWRARGRGPSAIGRWSVMRGGRRFGRRRRVAGGGLHGEARANDGRCDRIAPRVRDAELGADGCARAQLARRSGDPGADAGACRAFGAVRARTSCGGSARRSRLPRRGRRFSMSG